LRSSPELAGAFFINYRAAEISVYGFNKSGNLAILAAIRRASS
jgi:hypothetical protein